jgi:hypothetical protein
MKHVALLCALSVAASAAPAAAVTAVAQAPAAAAAAPAPVKATTWPKTYQQGGTKIVVYQPQVESWPNYTLLHALAAVAVTTNDSKTPVYGVARFDAYTSADFQTGEVQLAAVHATTTHWPNESAAVSSKLDALLRSTVQFRDQTIPLASVLASLDAKTALPKGSPVKTDPPVIFTSNKPAILVVYDRDPILAPIESTDLSFAVNTNWAVIYETPSGRYYLLDVDHWLSAPAYNGPWSPATAPASFGSIPDDANFTEVRRYLNAPALAEAQMPQVFVSTRPADLIAISGEPKFETIPGTHLKFVSNTDSDVFFYEPSTQWYVLLSGRWFRAANLTGPWTFATNSLPADFKKIPVNGPRGRVLVSVPGQPIADYAGASTQVPQIARVNPQTTKLEVTYGPGEPQFESIEGTSLEYAVNTPYDVIKISDTLYYACYSGVWFSAASPTGPWTVAYYVPQAIYTIPISSPLYADTFVHVYNPNGTYVTSPVPVPAPTATPYYNTAAEDAALGLFVGFTAGYLGGYWGWGAWNYGTGWYYPGWYGGGAYYPYPGTWTGGSYYNPATGAYGRSASVYGPYGGATARAQYNPTTGTYARGAAAYGPNGRAAAGSFYNPRYGVGGRTVQGSDPYGSWGRSAVSTRYGNAYTAHASTSNGQIASAATRHGTSTVARSSNGDIYAGHNGDVYRNQDGTWQHYDGNNNWSNVQKPATAPGQRTAGSTGSYQRPDTSSFHPDTSSFSRSNYGSLDRDFGARQSSFSGFHGFGGGGFRGGGFGGFRGGGGFRR